MSEETQKNLDSKEIAHLQNRLSKMTLLLVGAIFILIISVCANVYFFTREEKAQIGATFQKTNDLGENVDNINAGYFWLVYDDVSATNDNGTVYSLLPEEEILKLLMDEALEVEYDALSSPSVEGTRYRVQINDNFYWIGAPNIEEETADTTDVLPG